MSTHRPPKDQGARNRQLRVGEVIRRRLAEVLSRSEVHDPELNRHIITVSEVRTSTDLKLATAYVMPLGGQEAEAALKALRRNKAELRHLTGQGLTLKYTPDLRFELDTVFDKMDEARRIFSDPKVQADLARPDTEGDAQAGEAADGSPLPDRDD